MYKDPFRLGHHLIIFCECYDDIETKLPNAYNHRIALVEIYNKLKDLVPLAGIE